MGFPWYWSNHSSSKMPKSAPNYKVDRSFDFLAYCDDSGSWCSYVYWRRIVCPWLFALPAVWWCPMWYVWCYLGFVWPCLGGWNISLWCMWILNGHIWLSPKSAKFKILHLILSFKFSFPKLNFPSYCIKCRYMLHVHSTTSCKYDKPVQFLCRIYSLIKNSFRGILLSLQGNNQI